MNNKIGFTSLQQELWIACAALPLETPSVCTNTMIDLDEIPDENLLKKAAILYVNHNPLMASRIMCDDDDKPFFETGFYNNVTFETYDFTALSEEESARKTAEVQSKIAETPFPVENSQLYAFYLIKQPNNKAIFVLRVHHSVLDGYASARAFNTISHLYKGLKTGVAFELGEPWDWSADVADDEKHLQSIRYRKDMDFWKKYLTALPEEPFLTPRGGVIPKFGKIVDDFMTLPVPLVKKMQQLSQKTGSGIPLLMTELFAAVLTKLYDKEKISLSLPFLTGERHDELKIFGHRINTVPFVIENKKDQSLAQILKTVQSNYGIFLRHVKTPIQHAMRTVPDFHEKQFVFDVSFVYFPYEPFCEGLKIRDSKFFSSKYETFLLKFFAQQYDENRITLLTSRHEDYFSAQDVLSFVERVEILADAMLENPDVSLGTVDLTTAKEKEKLEKLGHGEVRPFPQTDMATLFDQTAEKFSDRTAVLCENGERRTYAEIKDQSDKIAAGLRQSGVKPGDTVAVLARRTVNLPETLLGVIKAGAVYLPVDPEYPRERIDFMLSDSAAKKRIALIDEDLFLPFGVVKAPKAEPLAREKIDPEKPAYLIYTSGSTGNPKGVVVPHKAFVNMITAQIRTFGIEPTDRVLQFASPSFDASLSETMMALMSGATLCPISRSQINEMVKFPDYLKEKGITVATLPPSYLNLADHADLPLRVLITAGEAPVVEDAFYYAKRLRYFNAYGPTETAVCATIGEIKDEINIGRPIDNSDVCLLDADYFPVPEGHIGELYVSGVGLAIGYLNRPELTASRFVEIRGKRYYRTGDLAYYSKSGFLVLAGRTDDQVKIRGHRVEIGEVETVIENDPDVVKAAVLVDAGSLLAFIKGKNQADILTRLRKTLPDYMLPSVIRMVDEIPVTPTGKTDKKALMKKSGRVSEHSENKTVTECQKKVLEAYSVILDYPVDNLTEDFYRLGGDSIKAIKLVRLLSEKFSKRLSVREFLAASSVTEVADCIESLGSIPSPEESLSVLPLSDGQMQLWAQECFYGASARYNMPFAFETERSEAEVADLANALKKALEAQPLTGARIEGSVNEPLFALKKGNVEIKFGEYSDLALENAVNRPFDLQQATSRIDVLKKSTGKTVFVVTVHHIAGDGESMAMILYEAFNGNSDRFDSRAAALNRFIATRKAYLAGRDVLADCERIKEQLLGIPCPLSAGKETGDGRRLKRSLTVTERQKLDTFSVSDTALIAALTARFFGQAQTVIATPTSLRDTAELSDVAGYFVNVEVFKVIDDGSNFRSFAGKVDQAIRDGRISARCPLQLLKPLNPATLMVNSIDFRTMIPDVTDVSIINVPLHAAKVPYNFMLVKGDDYTVELEYDTGVISEEEAQALFGRFSDFVQKTLGEEKTTNSVLATAWKKILNVEPTDKSDFFEEGGDSIKAIRMSGFLQKEGKTSLAASDFLKTPRFLDLKNRLSEEKQRIEKKRIIADHDEIPLTALQKSLLKQSCFHRVYMAMPLCFSADKEAIKRAIFEINEKREAFHLRFSAGKAFYSVLAEKPIVLETQETDYKKAAQKLFDSFNLEKGRLWGIILMADNRMVLGAHHLITDAVSFENLRADIAYFLEKGVVSPEKTGFVSFLLSKTKDEEDDLPNGTLPTQTKETDLFSDRIFLEREISDFSNSAMADSVLEQAVFHVFGSPLKKESHGRNDDTEMSVGWFTTTKILTPDGEKPKTKAPIALNYFASFEQKDSLIWLDMPFAMSLSEISVDGDFRSDCPLEIRAFSTAENKLKVMFHFSEKVLSRTYVEQAFDRYMALVEQGRRIPLLPTQENMIFTRHSAEYSFVEQFALKKKEVNLTRLLQAWESVVARHENLRLYFPEDDNGERCVETASSVKTEIFDLSFESDYAAKRQAVADKVYQSFDTKKPPLFIATFIKGDGFVEILWTFHHVLMDGWCNAILINDLMQLYFGEKLPSAQNYSAFRKWLYRQDENLANEFWKKYLAGIQIEKSFLPYGTLTGNSIEKAFSLSPEDSLKFKKAALALQTTQACLAQGIWGMFLHGMLSGNRDFLSATILSGRPAEVKDIEETIGNFSRRVPLRLKWAESDSFGDFVKTLSVDFPPVGSESEIQRTIGADRLFNSGCVVENYPIETFLKFGMELVSGREYVGDMLMLYVLPFEITSFRFATDSGMFSSADLETLETKFLSVVQRVISAVDIKNTACRDIEESPFKLRHYPEITIAEQFAQTVGEFALKTAVENADGSSWTYRELDEASDRVAAGLDLKKGEIVAVSMPRCKEALAVVLGIVKAGGVFLPLDEKAPSDRVLKTLEIAGNPKIVSRFEPSDRPFKPVAGSIDDPLYVMFTSGSTGEPKGVVVSNRGVMRLVCDSRVADDFKSRTVLQMSQWSFDASTLEIWAPLLSGGKVCFAEFLDFSDDLLKEKRIDAIWLTAALFDLVAQENPEYFSEIKVLYTGGEVVRPLVAGKVLAVNPDLKLCDGYGPTENAVFTTTCRITPEMTERSDLPIGYPVDYTTVIIETADGHPASAYEVGEILTGGDGLAIGYLNRPDLTEKAFVFRNGERFYKTGDLGYKDTNGILYFKGRRDAQVKVRGYRIELSEIEKCLMPLTDQVCVAALPDGGDKRIVAFVVTNRTKAELISAVKEKLPSYMMPDSFEFRSTLPLTETGKIDRKMLEKQTEKTDQSENLLADEGGLTDKITKLFSVLLNKTELSADSDFFELGGHSLKVLKLIGMLKKQIDADVSFEDVGKLRTPRKIAEQIKSKKTKETVEDTCLINAPLTPQQKNFWVMQKTFPDSWQGNSFILMDLIGKIDRTRLQKALTELEMRYDTLRIRLPNETNLPQMLGDPSLKLEITTSDQLDVLSRTPFVFGYDKPLVRAYLMPVSDDKAVFLIMMHHTITDGHTMGLLFRDFMSLYKGKELKIKPPSYLSYAVKSQNYEKAREKCLRRLGKIPEKTVLPADFVRSETAENEAGVLSVKIPDDVLIALKAKAADLKVSDFCVFLAILSIFIGRHAGKKEVVFGTLSANRNTAEEIETAGLFFNTIALKISLAETFDDQIRIAFEELTKAVDEQAYPFEELLNDLHLVRTGAGNPLYSVVAACEDETWDKTETYDFGDFKAFLRPIKKSEIDEDLRFYFRETKNCSAEIEIHYRKNLFLPETVDRFADRLLCLLETGLETGKPSMMTERDKAELKAFNATEEDFDLNGDLYGEFEKQRNKTPTATALIGSDGTEVSYAELDERAGYVAADLIKRGVRPGDYVGVCFDRSLDMMTAIYGLLKAGAVYVPFVPTLPDARLRDMQEDLGNPIVVAQSEYVSRFGDKGIALSKTSIDPVQKVAVSPDTTAYVIFTSGSTGRPKGAALAHRGALNRLKWMQSAFPLKSDDVILQKTTVSFDVSVWELFWGAETGAKTVMLEKDGEKNPEAIVNAIERFGVTTIHFVPSMLHFFLYYLETHPARIAAVASLHRVFASGEALTPDLVARFNRLLFETNGTELHNLYGPTEATVDVTWQPCSPCADLSRIPIGKPVANTKIYIMDSDNTLQPVGVEGEICISGVQVGKGYLNRPELTAAQFIDDPFEKGQRLYRTGDVGRWLGSGVVEYVGRCDDQVKIRGFRIDLGDVESAMEGTAGVLRAAVRVGGSENQKMLEAFIIPDSSFSLSVLRNRLKEKLPNYMVPAVYYLTDSFPTGSSGKTNRKELTGRRAENTVVEKKKPEASSVADQISNLWREVLPDNSTISPTENFFDAGGTSLLLITLHEKLNKAFPNVFEIGDLFSLPTIESQAELVEKKNPTEKSVLDAAACDDIAIIGMAIRAGDFEDEETFKRVLKTGSDLTDKMKDARARDQAAMLAAVGLENPVFSKQAYLDDIFSFDYARFKMSPSDGEMLDPEQRLFLHTAVHALENAGYAGSALDNRNVGVFIGASPSQTFKEAVVHSFPEHVEQSYVLNVPSNMAARLSYRRGWTGPAEITDTACSSGLTALAHACDALKKGDCDVALAGAAKVMLSPLKSDKSFAIESRGGHTRPFDAQADGTSGGEGSAVFVLKTLSAAVKDGDHIRAVVKGYAINQNGRSTGIAAPNPVMQAAVEAEALHRAGVKIPSLVEAHGTATALGDVVEIDGLRRAFKTDNGGRIPISSVKGNVGHWDAAAAAVGLFKAVLELEEGSAYLQANFDTANPKINFADSPVFPNAKTDSLKPENRPWSALVSAFGLSGINAAAVLGQAPEQIREAYAGQEIEVAISAGSRESLRIYADRLIRKLKSDPQMSMESIAATLLTGRDDLTFGVVFSAASATELAEKITLWRLGGTQGQEGWKKPVFRGKISKVNLPFPPFEKIRLIPDFKPLRPTSGLFKAVFKTQDGTAYVLPTEDNHFWCWHGHRLNGKNVLVGTAFSALIQIASKTDKLFLKKTEWLLPAATEPLILELSGKSCLLSSGKVVCATAEKSEEKQRPSPCAVPVCAPLPVRERRNTIISIDDRWNALTGLSRKDARVVAELRLDARYISDLQTYPLHPALLDCAVSSVLSRDGFVLAACAETAVYEALPPHLYAISDIVSETDDKIVSNCRLLDEDGAVLADLTGLVFRRSVMTPILYKVIRKTEKKADVEAAEHVDAADFSGFVRQMRDRIKKGITMPLRVGIDFADPLNAALTDGFLKALQQEEPTLSCCAVDKNGEGLVVETERLKEPAETERKSLSDGVVVITGAGGMARAFAQKAIPLFGKRVVFLSKTVCAEKTDEPTVVCDVTDKAALTEALEKIRREYGKITGVFHTAGIAGRGFLINKTDKDFESVLRPKLAAADLYELTRSDALTFFVVASSRTALFGAAGQTDYTAANAWLNEFARLNAGVTAIDFNTIASVGMAAKNNVATTGYELNPADIADVVYRAVIAREKVVAVALSGEPLSPPEAQKTSDKKVFQSKEEMLYATAAEVLGYKNPVLPTDNFYALGGDSVAGLRLVSLINERAKSNLTLADLFGSAVFSDLAAKIVGTRDAVVEKAPDLDFYPVSEIQKSILNDVQATDTTAYNLPQFLQFNAPIDRDRLENAVTNLIKRHEILRTVFVGIHTQSPLMKILPPFAFALQVKETDVPEQEVVPFDVTAAPLFRAKILKTKTQELFYFDIHHALADAYTVSVLTEDLLGLYQGKILPDPVVQFKDAVWALKDRSDITYWKEKFKDGIVETNLYSDFARPAVASRQGAIFDFSLPEAERNDFRQLALRFRVSPYLLTLALWAAVFKQAVDGKEFVLSTTMNLRSRSEWDRATGLLVSFLPLKLNPESEVFQNVLETVKKEFTDAAAHADVSVSGILKETGSKYRPDREPLGEIALSYMNFAEGTEETEASPVRIDRLSVTNDLTIYVTDRRKELSFSLLYATDLITRNRAEQLANAFKSLFFAVLKDGDSVLCDTIVPRFKSAVFEKRAVGKNNEVKGENAQEIIDLFKNLFKEVPVFEDSDFFALGGHSLKLIQLKNEIQKKTGRKISVRRLIENPTPAGIAALVAQARAEDNAVLSVTTADGIYRASPAQQGLYVEWRRGADQGAYNVPLLIEGTRFDENRLRDSMRKLTERHEILRTFLKEKEGVPVQCVLAQTEPDFETDVAENEAEALQKLTSFCKKPFDLGQAPLMRSKLVRAPEKDYLGVCLHHSVADGWALQIFGRDLTAFYDGTDKDLPTLTEQYRDFSVWQNSLITSENSAIWRNKLDGFTFKTLLPVGFYGKESISCRETITLSETERMSVAAFAEKESLTVSDVLLSLYAALLYRWTGQKKIVIATGFSGRSKSEYEQLIGYFYNTLPVPFELDDSVDFSDLAKSTSRNIRHLLALQNYPFSEIVREVRPSLEDRKINVAYEYQRYGDLMKISAERKDGIKTKQLSVTAPARYDLTLFVQETPDGTVLKMEYDGALFEKETILNMLDTYHSFLGGIQE